MPHYVVVQLTPKDPETLDAYRARGKEPVVAHGGRQIAGGPGTEVLEDNGAGTPAAVLLEFPSAEAARGWINDPDYAEVHALRRAGAHTTITLLPPVS